MAEELTNEIPGESPTTETRAPEPAGPEPADQAPIEAPAEPRPTLAESGAPSPGRPKRQTRTHAAARNDREAPGETGRERARRGRPGGGGPRGRGGRAPAQGLATEDSEFEETVVKVYRCATVVKGGRRFSFGALVVMGDRNGRVGIGYGKANEVPSAVEKGTKAARQKLVTINLAGTTIPHQVVGRYGASKVVMVPAGEGTGVIAGASVRAVMELAGVKDVLTKSYGSRSPKNLVKAAFGGLVSLRSKEDVARLREVSMA